MRFVARENSYLEGWDIVDTQQWAGTEDKDTVCVMTVWNGCDVQKVLDWLNSGVSDV